MTTAGKVGSETARLLRQRDIPVRVLVRNPARATALATAGAELATGDLDVPASIDEAMAGVETVVLVSPAVPGQELMLAPVIAQASSFGSAAGKGRTGMVDARDVAAVAAEIAGAPAAHAGQAYRLTGPELISNYDVAAMLSGLLGRAITYRELSSRKTGTP